MFAGLTINGYWIEPIPLYAECGPEVPGPEKKIEKPKEEEKPKGEEEKRKDEIYTLIIIALSK